MKKVLQSHLPLKKIILKRRQLHNISSCSSGDSGDEMLYEITKECESMAVAEEMETDIGSRDEPPIYATLEPMAPLALSPGIPSTSTSVVPPSSSEPSGLPVSFYKRNPDNIIASVKRTLFGNETDNELDFDESEGSERDSDVGLGSDSELSGEGGSGHGESGDGDSDEDDLHRPIPSRRGVSGSRVRRQTRGRRARRR